MKSKTKVISIVLFLSVFMILGSTVYAHAFKLIQGFSLSSYTIQPEVWRDIDWGTVYTFETAHREGLLSGIGFEFTISKNLAIEIEGLYFQKGCFIKVQEFPYFNMDYALNVVSLPILLKISPLSKLSVYILGGGEVSLIITHKADGWNITPVTKGFDYGYVLGGGFEVKISKRSFFIEGRYHQGLRNILEERSWYFDSLKTKAFVLILALKI
jgi:hypothetical protein